MSEDSIEINGLDIKPYIISQRNCRAASTGYVMEPINSNFVIDLSSFSGNIKATVIFSRISGNGKVKVNNIYTDVLSKTSHQIDLDIIQNKKIEISRDQNSVGKIILNSIKVINVIGITNQSISSMAEPEETLKDSSQNWQQLLMKLGNTRGIKLTNNRIFASENAQIQHANIIELIQTDPPQSFATSNVIKFINACEIKYVSFKEEFRDNIFGSENKYRHFTKPPQLQSNPLVSINKLANNINTMTSTKSNNIIYDSFTSGLDPNLLINPKEIISGQGKNNNGLLLKREAGFAIPISGLKANMQYVVVANLRKISGNGKFGVEFGTTDGEKRSSTIIIAPDRDTELYIKLNTNEPPSEGNSYILKVFRPEDSTVGDVLLDRLMIIQGITLANMHTGNTPINANVNSLKINRTNDLDSVRATSKQYSRRMPHTKTEPQFNHSGSICIKDISAMNWFNKIQPLCPKINAKDYSPVMFGKLGSLNDGEKFWIEPFNDDFISDTDNSILKRAKIIVSPSLQNVELFQKLYTNAKVILSERPWPLIETTPLKYPAGDYVVMTHRSKEITEKVLEAYDSKNNPPLVLIGAVDPCPDFVIPMNEYVAYDKMLGLVLTSKLLIDINTIDDYMSGVLSIAFDSGVPVLTSNWFGLNKNNCKFIVAKDKIGKINIPKIEDITAGIKDGLKLEKINVTENHNDKLDKFLSIFFER